MLATDHQFVSTFNKSIENKALQISGIAIWEFNLLSKEVKCHDNWFTLLGYSQFELPKKISTFYELVHPEDLHVLEDARVKYLFQKEIEVLEVQFRMKTKSGKWKWLRNKSILEVDDDNTPTKWLGSVMEISRLKESENNALKNMARLNSVVNSLSDIIYEIDENYIFLNSWVSDESENNELIKGFIGREISTVFNPYVSKLFKQIIDTTIITGKAQQLEYQAKRSKKHYLARTTLIPNKSGAKNRVTMIIQDMTDFKNTRLELEQKQANLNAMIQNTSDVFWAIDKHEKMLVFNKAFSDMYFNLSGRSCKIGDEIYDDFLMEETAKRWRMIHARSLQGHDTEFSKHIYFTDGRVRLYEFHINPFKNQEGKIIGSVVTGRDIDDIYTAKKQAEKAARLKSKFVSTISHEIRTPLNAILGTCYQLEQNNQQENLAADLDILHLASDNLLSLINDVLDFTKLDSGKSTIKETQFNLKDLLTGIQQFSTNLAQNKNLKLNINISDNLPDIVSSDKTKLHQILTNLLSNAIKYTDTGSVNFNVVLKSTSTNNVALQFEISDTGIGIPKEDIDGVFDSFTQSTTSYNLLKGGTGLGLAITKNLVQLLGGKISVVSKLGIGSTFILDLNLDVPPQKEISNTQISKDFTLEGIHVLVAEDNEINAMIITRLLGQWNATFDHADNGEIAVEYAQKNKYNLILMDIQMPKKNGFQASDEIRQNCKSNENTPILALTAQPDFLHDPSYKENIFNGYILKPFHPDQLKADILNKSI
jgi:PAS domain S-box-containing protein